MSKACFAGLLGTALLSPLALQASEPRWFTIETSDGQAFGHSRIYTEETPAGRVVTNISVLFLKEDETPTQRVREVTRNFYNLVGRLVAIEQRSGTRERPVLVRVALSSGEARITRRVQKESHSFTVALPPGTRFDNGEGLLSASALPITFQSFILSAGVVERMEIEAAPQSAGKAIRSLLRTSWSGNELRSATRIELDANGEIASTHQPMFGTIITTRPSTEQQAMAATRPFGMDHAGLVKFPYRISNEAKAGRIRFAFRFSGGFAFPLPQTGSQRVTANATHVTLDICSACGVATPLDEASRADALRATAWLQSDHKLLQQIANPIRAMAITDAEKMERLAKAARKRISKTDFIGHYSALESLRRGAGDCTEDAVTLAALGRAAGIPTKVASGLVYSRDRHHGLSNVFMPHSWALAWIDGRWQSFDMSLGAFDATHLAFTIGDGDPRSINAASALANLLEWRDVQEVRKRPN